MKHRSTALALSFAALLAACGDERVAPPVSPPVSGAPISGVPIAGAPTGPATPVPAAAPAAAAGAESAAPPAAVPAAPPAVAPAVAPAAEASAPGAVPPTPESATAPAAGTSGTSTAADSALGDPAGPDPASPGDDPILAAQMRAASEAASAAQSAMAARSSGPEASAGRTGAAPPEPKKVVEEKPVAAKADPKKTSEKAEKPELIGFDVLGAFEYTAPNPDVPGSFEKSVASIPEDVRLLEGRTITVEGYMIPLEYAPDDDGVKSFFLSRYQIGCCIGVMPRANELVEVTMDGPKWAPYVSWMPVRATGVIHVGPKEGDTATLSGIYRMHEPVVTVPEPEEVELESDHAR